MGSSPLTRGKRSRTTRHQGRAGLIPAHAGKTSPTRQPPAIPGAHPRSRGENFAGGVDFGGSGGSSPLTRGKLSQRESSPGMRGLIPAHAGKTAQSWACAFPRRAHPRSRGENTKKADRSKIHRGSSPLTRGKPYRAKALAARGRLIPAHAGKTQRTGRACAGSRAHPRSRGENVEVDGAKKLRLGSSPLTRGKHQPRRARHPRDGLIPAHAGKTCSWFCPRAVSRAHPRSRGENVTGGPYSQSSTGSSPLTRGKRMRPLRM